MSLKEFLRVMVSMNNPQISLHKTDAVALYELVIAIEQLREAQQFYMVNRGNEEIGQIIATTANEIDSILAEINRD